MFRSSTVQLAGLVTDDPIFSGAAWLGEEPILTIAAIEQIVCAVVDDGCLGPGRHQPDGAVGAATVTGSTQICSARSVFSNRGPFRSDRVQRLVVGIERGCPANQDVSLELGEQRVSSATANEQIATRVTEEHVVSRAAE